MTGADACDRPTDTRGSPRTNLFLGALLRGPDFATPVTIRNMSPTGALVESPVAPDPSKSIFLTRGSLSVGGVVAWCANGRCGLRFNSEVCVSDWLPPAKAQQRVDRVVQLVQSGASHLSHARSASRDLGKANERPPALSADIRCVSRLLKSLGEDLSNDETVLAAHSDQLQHFDIAVQMLSAISDLLNGEDVQLATNRLENLRASCAEARCSSG